MHIKEVGYIVERLADRFRDLGGQMAAQEAAHKTALEELRAGFNARTASDEHRLENLREEIIRLNEAHGRTMVERDGLQAQVQDLRAALAKEQELHAATALRLATEAAKLVERKKHPVKVGEWVRRTDAECESIHWGLGVVAQVMEVYSAEQRYNVTRPDWNGDFVPWDWELCTPCDPPTADHDTPAGKAAAESVIRNDRKTEPADDVKEGDVVEVVSATHRLYTEHEDLGCRGVVTVIDGMRLLLGEVPGYKLPIRGIVGKCDVRKVTT